MTFLRFRIWYWMVLIPIQFVLVANAQLCQGSLGDPVVNKTFGIGPNPGQPLPAGITNYFFVNNGCPNDGMYTIANSTAGCFNNSWFTVNEDHTPGDVNGYMMIVNASNNPGDFYVETVTGLCPNTTYEFASWILNVLNITTAACGNVVVPNITFKIETPSGTVLQSFNTGNFSSPGTPTWKQYGFNFVTPAGVNSVVLRMTNNAPGGCGNDLIIDDITFRPCGPQVLASLSGGGNRLDLCSSDKSGILINGSITSGYVNPVYQWQESKNNGASWTDIAGATGLNYLRPSSVAGNYLYRLSVAESTNISTASCRVNSSFITIEIHDLPAIHAKNNGPLCEGQHLVFSADTAASFEWTGVNGFFSNNTSPTINNVVLTDAGKYFVKATSSFGCINVDSTIVSINRNPVASVGPNALICEGTSTILSGAGGLQYAWSPSMGLSDSSISNPIASPVDTTLYILTVSNGPCKDTASVIVNVLKKPVADAGPDRQIFEGETIAMQGHVGGTNIVFNWAPTYNISSVWDINADINPLVDTTYTLHVHSNVGCGDADDKVFIRVFKKLVVPNVFSPNNDGVNDYWQINNLVFYPESDMNVFDRYGKLVYHSKGYSNPWDGKINGKALPVGTYYFTIDLKNGLKVESGSVTILR